MSAGDWGGFAVRCDLAQVWGVTEPHVRRLAAEAHRLTKLEPEELEQLRSEFGDFCRAVMAKAAVMPNAITGLPDWRAAIEAVKAAAAFAGIDLEQTHTPQVEQKIEIVVLPAGEAKPEPESGKND